MDAQTHLEPSIADTPSNAQRWVARIGSCLWLVILLGVMLAKGRFEPLLLLALAVPFVALFVVFDRLSARQDTRPLAASVLVTGIGLLLVWVDRLITWRPEWTDLVAPDTHWREESLRFAAIGGWIAVIGGIAVFVIARRLRKA